MSYTREQAEEVWNDYQNSELSFNNFLNHKFGKQLEVGKWYRDMECSIKIKILELKEECLLAFGVDKENEWSEKCSWYEHNLENARKRLVPMTDEEVHDLLKSECEKRYKVGDVVKNSCSFNVYEIQGMEVRVGYTALFLNGVPVLDLTTGEWAEVVKKDPIAEQIEKLEKELQTLKTKYNEQNK